jgi:hypothetical protein
LKFWNPPSEPTEPFNRKGFFWASHRRLAPIKKAAHTILEFPNAIGHPRISPIPFPQFFLKKPLPEPYPTPKQWKNPAPDMADLAKPLFSDGRGQKHQKIFEKPVPGTVRTMKTRRGAPTTPTRFTADSEEEKGGNNGRKTDPRQNPSGAGLGI